MGTLFKLETSTSGYIFSTSTKKEVFWIFGKNGFFDFFSSFFHFPRSDVHAKLVHGVLWIHVHPGLQSLFLL